MHPAANSFGAEGDDRVYAGGLARREIAGEQSAGGKNQGHGENGEDVVAVEAIDKGAHHSAGGHGDDNSGGDAGGEKQQRMAQHEPDDGAARRAERQTDTKLAGALTDGVRQEAVDSSNGDGEGGQTEDAEKPGSEGLVSHGVVHNLRHGLEVLNGDIGLQLMDGGLDGLLCLVRW